MGYFFSVFVVDPDWPLPRVFQMISVTVSLQKLLIIKPLCSLHIIKFLDWFNLIWLLQEICPLHVEWWTYNSNQSWKACLQNADEFNINLVTLNVKISSIFVFFKKYALLDRLHSKNELYSLWRQPDVYRPKQTSGFVLRFGSILILYLVNFDSSQNAALSWQKVLTS